MARFMFKAALVLLGLLVAGFGIFVITLPGAPTQDEVIRADAIVVLTGGGGGRIDAGVRLLEKHKGARLLISGVHASVKPADIQHMSGLDDDLMRCCVDLGRRARDTVGNAGEIALWAERHHYHRLIVVTSAYHMPRALIELRTSLPGATLVAFPVTSSMPGEWRRTGVEYLKYVAIMLRETLLHLPGSQSDSEGAPS